MPWIRCWPPDAPSPNKSPMTIDRLIGIISARRWKNRKKKSPRCGIRLNTYTPLYPRPNGDKRIGKIWGKWRLTPAKWDNTKGCINGFVLLSQSSATLSATRQKIIADALRDFKLSGVALQGKNRGRFRQNSERLATLAAKFEENILDATNDFSYRIDDESLLGDMPADLKAAAQDGDGYQLTLQPPAYAAFMQYSPARELRERLYRAYNIRASEFGPQSETTPRCWKKY